MPPLNPAFTPQGGKVGGRQGPLKDWRGKIIRGMEQMPGRRGTAQDIIAKVEEMLGTHHPALDHSISPGGKSRERWHMAVKCSLRHGRDVFVRTDEKAPNPKYCAGDRTGTKKELSIWQYYPPVEGLQPRKSALQIHHNLHGPKQPSKETATKKSLNTVKAFR